jgi:hypothetical protein
MTENLLKRRLDDHDYLEVYDDEDTSSSFCSTTSSSLMNPNLVVLSSSSSSGAGQIAPKKKRQRLTHLTPDEKLQRRKLKNRVAAQSARDRKKARMEELETILDQIKKDNERLSKENRELKNTARQLLEQNRKLLEAKKTGTALGKPTQAPIEVDGSAASALNVSLPWTQLRSVPALTNSRSRPLGSSLLNRLRLYLAFYLVFSSVHLAHPQPTAQLNQQRRRSALLRVLAKIQEIRHQRRRSLSSITTSRQLKRNGLFKLIITNFPT